MKQAIEAKRLRRIVGGVTGPTMTRLMRDLGIGKGRMGETRFLALGEALTIALCATLQRVHGLVRDDALGLARDVSPEEWARLIADENAPRWLFARPDETGQARWVTAIVDDAGGLEILKTEMAGLVAVNLRSIAARVLEDVVVDGDTAGKGDAMPMTEDEQPLRIGLRGLTLVVGRRDGQHSYALALSAAEARRLAHDLLEEAASAEAGGDAALVDHWSKIGGSA